MNNIGREETFHNENCLFPTDFFYYPIFSGKTKLVYHSRSHTRVRPYGRWFRDKNDLRLLNKKLDNLSVSVYNSL